ncbi:MAG: HD-GYP domain-containing protein [Candidatus Polarisedimenticolaceae bacterium]|nr:HD-GYP domain-containing protein [Candidatus Polarisedimenticolaceae bacterium]
MSHNRIKPSQLCVGLYIQLDLSWMQHSFISNSFKIKSEKQLAELKKLNLSSIQYDPARSDTAPLPLVEQAAEVAAPEAKAEAEQEAAQEKDKQKRIKKVKERAVTLNRCEKAYAETAASLREVMRNIMSQPQAAVEEAGEIISGMVESLMENQEATMHLVNMKGKSESTYYHAINVTILALMLGRQLGLDEQQMQDLGTGAMFHDLGYSEIPDKILLKQEPLNQAEQNLIRMHPVYGVRQADQIGAIPPEAVTIIEQHHEMSDGSGYPKGLVESQISELAQIVALVNAYDNLCNQKDPSKSCSPYEAISTLFAKERHRFNKEKITLFITSMGVYPPGTVVKLSDETIAVVMSINPNALLAPKVMLYDADIPSTEARMLNLDNAGLKIVDSIRVSSLPEEIRSYFNLGDAVNIFIDSER